MSSFRRSSSPPLVALPEASAGAAFLAAMSRPTATAENTQVTTLLAGASARADAGTLGLGSPIQLDDAWQPVTAQGVAAGAPLASRSPGPDRQNLAAPSLAPWAPEVRPHGLGLLPSPPMTPPTAPWPRPWSSARSSPSPRTCAVEDELQAGHTRDQAAIARTFHTAPPDPAHSYVVNTVTPEEGAFLAAYLGLPEANVLKVKCHGMRPGSHVHRALRSVIEDFFEPKVGALAAITFLGHMERDDQDRLKFASLHAEVLFDLIAELRPRALNFFSCSSEAYATQIGALFAEHRGWVPKMTCFADDVEVSQWPRRANKHKPLRMFYAGPEIGAHTPRFSPALHSHVLPWVRQLRIPGVRTQLGADEV